jgi:hypothetical protein
MARSCPTPVFAADEVRRMRQEQALPVSIHRKEAARDGASAVVGAAMAWPATAIEGVEPVVDGDFLADLDSPPCEAALA